MLFGSRQLERAQKSRQGGLLEDCSSRCSDSIFHPTGVVLKYSRQQGCPTGYASIWTSHVSPPFSRAKQHEAHLLPLPLEESNILWEHDHAPASQQFGFVVVTDRVLTIMGLSCWSCSESFGGPCLQTGSCPKRHVWYLQPSTWRCANPHSTGPVDPVELSSSLFHSLWAEAILYCLHLNETLMCFSCFTRQSKSDFVALCSRVLLVCCCWLLVANP